MVIDLFVVLYRKLPLVSLESDPFIGFAPLSRGYTLQHCSSNVIFKGQFL